jgi:Flp pilus assembly protein RcpC/CpaB
MPPRPLAGLDLVTGALIVGGACLLAASIVAAVVFFTPAQAPPSSAPEPTAPSPPMGRPAAALPADRVATVLAVDATAGAGSAVRAGDHVDVVAFLAQQTHVLLENVPVLDVDRTGSSIALTLAVPQTSALVLQESQALGARPFVMLRPLQPVGELPTSFSNADLAAALTR